MSIILKNTEELIKSINIFLNKIKLSFIDALYRIINGHNSTINSQFYIFIITTNIN